MAETSSPTAGRRRARWSNLRQLPIWQSLSVRDFRLLWLGESISVLGDQFYFVALPWLTLQLTGSAVALGTVLATTAVPRAALILFGGALADRVSPRLLMLGSNAARTVLTVLLAALVLLGGIRLWQVYVLAVLFGTVDALFYPAFDAFPPLILDEERLGSGNALLQGTDQGSSLLGPALAGVLIAAVGGSRGIGIAFAIDALSFAFATVALLLMRGGNRTAASTEVTDVPGRQARRLMRDIAAGLIYAWKDPILRILVIVAAAASVAINSPLSVGLATLAHSRFSGGAAAFGLMFTVLGVGGLAGTIAAGMIQRPRHRGLTIIGILLAFSVGMIAIALLPNLLIVCAILGALGITNGLVGVLLATWLQIRTAQDMLGRVMSILTFGQFGLAPLSLAVAGLLAQQSVTLLLVAAGLLMAAIALAAAASPTLRTFD